VQVPLGARIARQMQTPPFGIERGCVRGRREDLPAECAECHGTPGHDVAYAKYMYPVAPQLWKKHPRGQRGGRQRR
jgi:thiosulfate dehydrogenase